MKTFLKLTTALVFSAATSAAFAHARLQKSTPPDGATLAQSPNELRFEFNEAVEPAMSSVKVWGLENSRVATDRAEVANDDDKVLRVKLPALSPGAYRAEWSTMGHDGHHTNGTVKFTVK